MDDMIVKSSQQEFHTQYLQQVFKTAQKYIMRLNLKKCKFGVRIGKFLGFYLTERGIEANPEKCEAVIQMSAPTLKKEVQKLSGMLTSLNKFISKSAQHACLSVGY